MIKDTLRTILSDAIARSFPGFNPSYSLSAPNVAAHGDLAANAALVLSKQVGMKPVDVAKKILASIEDSDGLIESSRIAGPGFLNFTIPAPKWIEGLREVREKENDFGRSGVFQGERAVVEFVSANPTGPLHVGNARGGPLGDAIANLLAASGYAVTREFYINDVGGQIDKLGESILAHLKPATEASALDGVLGYQGDYVRELAEEASKAGIPRKAASLGRFGIEKLLGEIRKDCDDMGVTFDSWVSEEKILESGATKQILDSLKAKGAVVEKEGASWFVPRGEAPKGPPSGAGNTEVSPSTGSGQALPNQDRESVLERSDGRRPTYFANDIAYHVEKFARGFDLLVNVWGSNHHGHVSRIKAALQVLGHDPEKIRTVLYQYVRVKRGETAVKMSKRAGNFVTAHEVLDEVGRDAFRFNLLMRSPEAHLDFDLELAKKQAAENPVYYVQYAHARITSVFGKAAEAAKGGGEWPPFDKSFCSILDLPEEKGLAKLIDSYPEVVAEAVSELDPHRITHFLLDLARAFQGYYDRARGDDRYRMVTEEAARTKAKLFLAGCVRQVIRNGLGLLGVSAPEKM